MTTQVSERTMQFDVVNLLIGQHMEIRDLFVEVESATGVARRDAFQRLVRLLAVHETAEEQIVHPLTRAAVEGGSDVADARLAEEREAKELLAKLEDMDPDAPKFLGLLSKLRMSVLEHAYNEEAYEFRYLRREVGSSQLQALTAAVKAAEAMAPTHPHPGMESATANVVVGPVMSLFDQTKDLVRKALSDSR